jgi:hypothetical protein
VPPECWKPSAGLRAVAAASGLVKLGLFYLVLRFCFPRVFLTPALVIAVVAYVAGILARVRVRLDRAAGEVAITIGWWTKRVPLLRIERVDEVMRFGGEIKIAGGTSFGFSPFKKRRWLARLLKIRTGFEGIEAAITAAAAAARAADPVGAAAVQAAAKAAQSRRAIPAACVAFAGGVLSLAIAVAARPQAGGWLVHLVAVVLRIYFVAGCLVALPISAGILYSALRQRRTARQQVLSRAGRGLLTLAGGLGLGELRHVLHQAFGVGIGRVLQDLLDRSRFGHLTLAQDHRGLGDAAHQGEIVRDEDHGQVSFPLNPAQQLDDDRLHRDVQR